MSETDQPTEEYDVKAGFAAEDEAKPKPKRKAKPKVEAPVLHVNWLSVSHNARHPDVKVWQRQMQERGYDLHADGVFGLQSEAIAREFQAEKEIAEDGVVGPYTWQAAWAA